MHFTLLQSSMSFPIWNQNRMLHFIYKPLVYSEIRAVLYYPPYFISQMKHESSKPDKYHYICGHLTEIQFSIYSILLYNIAQDFLCQQFIHHISMFQTILLFITIIDKCTVQWQLITVYLKCYYIKYSQSYLDVYLYFCQTSTWLLQS